MSRLLKEFEPASTYVDKKFTGTREEYEMALEESTDVYVGNLAFFTREEQVYALFGRCGPIRRVAMGLDRNTKRPCGFCFVLFYARDDAERAVKCIAGTVLDERRITVDFDWGFQEGRQFGRGRSGGQVYDEVRTDYDQGRGGYGNEVKQRVSAGQKGGREDEQERSQSPPRHRRN